MKIAYFVEKFPLISETFVLAQITGMIERGHDVTIFAFRKVAAGPVHAAVTEHELLDRTIFVARPDKRVLRRLIPAIRAIAKSVSCGQTAAARRALNPRRHGRDALSLKLLLQVAPFFEQDGFDVIHCQFGHLGVDIAAIQQCGLIPGRLVTSFRGTDAMKVASRNPARFESLFRHDGDLLCVSNFVRDRLIKLGCPPNKAEVFRSGIDLERFAFRGAAPLHKPVRILSIGRLAPNKGLVHGIRAIARLVAAGYEIEYRLVGEGPSRSQLEDLVRSLDLQQTVQFDGALSSQDVAIVLQNSDILLTPSVTGPEGEQEGLPNAPKEAMAIGVPVVATSIGGIPELIRDGENGFLVAEKSDKAIAQCIGGVIDHWGTLEPLIRSARSSIEQVFEINQLNDRLEKKYRSMAGSA